jgi:DNA-binding NtrC family response regulator
VTADHPKAIIVVVARREATLAVLTQLRRKFPGSRLFGIFCASGGSAAPALEYFSHGLDDYLNCPWTETDLQLRLRRLLPPASPASEEPGSQHHALIGHSERFQRLLEQVSRAARSQATVLIAGETGTGKELVARAIHYLSQRTNRAFVPLNCGAVPDHLFENELFGHVKGAFTDASANERGLIAEAENGTLFLDEVDTLSPAAQVKILRLLQDHEYRPLGGARSVVADLRVVAATNADLPDLVRRRTFREDLYHRLCLLTLHVPPLRERSEDIPLLARHFLRKYVHESPHSDCSFDTDALMCMIAYHWPGNVRELENVIHRAMIMSPARVLRVEDLDIEPHPPVADSHAVVEAPFREAKGRAIHGFEIRYLNALLTRYRGNISQAADAAGTDRRTLQRLLEKHKLDRVSYRQSC